MNTQFKITTAVALVLVAVTASAPARAQGALDFLDSCIKARSDFAEQRQAYFAKLNVTESSVDTLTATPEFREAWLEEVRKQARALFDEKVAPALREMGVTDMEKGFGKWFELELAAIKPEDLDKRITDDFRSLAKQELRQIRTKSNAEFDKGQAELGDACKSDVGSQALRLALAPVGWVAGNFEAAKNEKNIVTQVFRAVTGVSPQAIAEHGLLGGDKSEARKVLEPVIGGPNGAIQKGAKDFANAVNPFKWKF
jgi:hypothetical protein